MTPVEQLLIALGGGSIAALCGAVAHLWASLTSERKARLEDLARYTDRMIEFRDRLREADATEIRRLREEAVGELEEPAPRSRDPRRKTKP